MNRYQRTIKNPIKLSGKGLHTGRFTQICLMPAPASTGIVFFRSDLDRTRPIPALWNNVSSTDLCTTIGQGDYTISTIEHLMAALKGFEIDNLHIELNGPEVPILDGSSLDFVEELKQVGFTDFSVQRKILLCNKFFEFSSNGRYFSVSPSDQSSFSCTIDFPNSVIGKQSISYKSSPHSFQQLCNARTFCHLDEVNALKRMGLAQGGSLDNAIVISSEGVLNEGGLRCEDEFVRHKLLDAIGDLALLGAEVVGHIEFYKPGHGFQAEVMHAIMANKDEYFSMVEPFSPCDTSRIQSSTLQSSFAFSLAKTFSR
jgi:UDP-3-O-[3-hydroxymyristoyl] N-acetylglucosamine deacetylase